MSKKTGIYIITNRINGKQYIGKSKDINRRFAEHKSVKHKGVALLKADIKEYGLDNFSFEILEECAAEKLNEREVFYIAKLKPEYNTASGGDGRRSPLSEETKARLRECGRRQWEAMTEEEKQERIKNNLRGPNKGHTVSAETREKLRNANLGKKQDEDTISKRRETCLKNGFYQRKREQQSKPIRCIETGVIYKSIKEAQTLLGLSNISKHLKGEYKQCGGLHFEYCSVETNCDECNSVG